MPNNIGDSLSSTSFHSQELSNASKTVRTRKGISHAPIPDSATSSEVIKDSFDHKSEGKAELPPSKSSKIFNKSSRVITKSKSSSSLRAAFNGKDFKGTVSARTKQSTTQAKVGFKESEGEGSKIKRAETEIKQEKIAKGGGVSKSLAEKIRQKNAHEIKQLTFEIRETENTFNERLGHLEYISNKYFGLSSEERNKLFEGIPEKEETQERLENFFRTIPNLKATSDTFKEGFDTAAKSLSGAPSTLEFASSAATISQTFLSMEQLQEGKDNRQIGLPVFAESVKSYELIQDRLGNPLNNRLKELGKDGSLELSHLRTLQVGDLASAVYQRVPRYALLLNGLIKHTPKHKTQDLKKAQKMVQDFGAHLNAILSRNPTDFNAPLPESTS